MRVLDRYVMRTILGYTVPVMGVLLSLGTVFLFVEEQDDIGVGTYGISHAFLFVLLNLPQQAFQFLPIGALIGALVGLGNLARGSELIAIRAAGVSVMRVGMMAGVRGSSWQ